MTIGTQIFSQLGGNNFVAMTGATNFVDFPSGMSFKLPTKSTKNGCSRIMIKLTAMDLYDVVFMKFWKYEMIKISEHTNIYSENLVELIQDQTGLYLSL